MVKKETDGDDAKLHKGHRERVRRKFIKSGFEGFEEHEILEMLLFYSVPRVDTNVIAHRLIDKYHSLSAVCDADIEDLTETDGVSESSAVLLKMVPKLAKAYMNSAGRNICLNSYKAVCEYFKSQFIGETDEKIRTACVDDKLRLISSAVVAEGSPGGVAVNIRRIVEFTYKCRCDNIILAHNHPNGDIIPSNEDIRATADIYNTLKSVGINLLDHIIVAGNQAVSLKESGAFSLLR